VPRDERLPTVHAQQRHLAGTAGVIGHRAPPKHTVPPRPCSRPGRYAGTGARGGRAEEDQDLDATMQAAFETSETEIVALERMITACGAQHDEAKTVRLERQIAGLRQNLAQRREAWARIKRREQ
jgi:hypothetical protein